MGLPLRLFGNLGRAAIVHDLIEMQMRFNNVLQALSHNFMYIYEPAGTLRKSGKSAQF